ncbi:MAG: putative pyrimidine precursor biosynthesis enzyme [Dehalococcoidia bacterium]|nr:putative pyrimidine precursor biosynthesis enzyme [Dehalococcoidia bacterium]
MNVYRGVGAAILVLAILLAGLLAACGKEDELEEVSLALDWYPNSNHAGFYMAQERGYYRDEGLKVNIYVPANPEDVLKTVGARRDDFGVSYQAEVLLARGEGVPVKSIAALVQHPLNSILVLAESGITRPGELSGKTVGITGIPFEEALFSAMLEHDGISMEDVTVVNVGFDLAPALMGKRVDAIVGAYWTHESILVEMQGYPVRVLRMEEWGVPDFYELVLVTSQDTVSKNPELVRRFLRATARGFADAMADPQGAVEVLVDANPETDRSLEARGIELLAPLWKAEGQPFGWQTRERWQALAQWMKDEGLLKEEVSAEDAFTSELLPK